MHALTIFQAVPLKINPHKLNNEPINNVVLYIYTLAVMSSYLLSNGLISAESFDIIWASMQQNLSLGFPTRRYSYQPTHQR